MDISLGKTVSVVIPCYKYAHYLKECVDSVKNQTYPVHEIIVVNDGSPDNTSEIAKELGVILVEKENGGLSSARNAGIKVATGEYIMCLDADDKLVPGAIEEHVKLMLDHMTIAQCALMEFGERHVVMTPIQNTSLERVMGSNTIYCNAMFSKEMWQDVGGYDESETMRLGYEDWEFWVNMLSHGCHVNTSDFIALRYRVHANNMTKETTWPNHQILYHYIYNKYRDLYERKGLIIAGLIL
jgi:glycosyltransferase involved in cell wall biosynthesis